MAVDRNSDYDEGFEVSLGEDGRRETEVGSRPAVPAISRKVRKAFSLG